MVPRFHQTPDYQSLFNASPYPYLLVDTGLVIIAANTAYLTVTGRLADEIVGVHIFEAFPDNPDDPDSTNLAEVENSIRRAIATKKPHSSALLRYAVPTTTSSGPGFDERYWSAIHTPVLNEAGEVLFVSQNAIDVTDLYRFDSKSKRYFLRQEAYAVPDIGEMNRPQMHEAIARILSVERSQLQIMFDQAPGFIAVMNGPSHVFELVNEAYYRMVGHRELIGKPVWEALPEVAGQGFEDLLDSVLATGRPVVLSGQKITVRRERDGPLHEVHVDLVYQPIVAEDGRVTGIFAQGHDVSAAYEATRELAEKVIELEQVKSRQAFQLRLADGLRGVAEPDEIFTIASELVGTYFGVSRVMFGDYNPNEREVRFHSNYTDDTVAPIEGIFPSAAVGADNFRTVESGAHWVSDDIVNDPRAADPAVAAKFAAWSIAACIVVPLTTDGATIACLCINNRAPRLWTDAQIALIREAADRIWSAVERTRAIHALQQADRRKDQFLAMLAHELRNPIAPISAAAEILKLSGISTDTIRKTSEVIGRQVTHMTGLIDDLLDVARVNTGLVSLERREVDIKQVVADAIEQVRPVVAARRHAFCQQICAESAFVTGDHKRLVQVVANLINNAAKYTPEGGRIALVVGTHPDRVTIAVQDNGIGISAELLPNLFELFAQGQRTPDRSQGGLGIGLALVKSLIGLHGGSVAVKSAGLDGGSEFSIRLPRVLPAAPPLAAPPSDVAAPPASAGRRLLIVDDNIDATVMLAMFMEAQGYEVAVEHDPFKALALAQQTSFYAFLLNIGLPGMDGHELAAQLRRIPAAREALMIAITGYDSEESRTAAQQAGFDHYVVKPADPGRIVDLLVRGKPADQPT